MNIVKTIPALMLIIINFSCAINYVDEDGNQRIIGLVSVKLERTTDSKLVAGDKVSISNIGVLVSKGPVHTGLSIGYNSETSIVLKNDIATIINKGLDYEKNQ